jgi:Ribonuclease G/E
MTSNRIDTIADAVSTWMGTTASLVLHTIFFLGAFVLHWVFKVDIDTILLSLTTIVSLEAIYLALFIQRSVNSQSVRLEEVEEILEDVEEDLEKVEESLDEVEESLEDVEEELDDWEAKQLRRERKAAREAAKEEKEQEKSMDELHALAAELQRLIESLSSKRP